MRSASQLATIDIWGEDSEELAQVKNAWYAVGVEESNNSVDVDDINVFTVYACEGKLFMDVVEGNTIEVYSVLGQLLTSVEAQSGITTISIDNVNNGVVVVKVGNQVQKVVIK